MANKMPFQHRTDESILTATLEHTRMQTHSDCNTWRQGCSTNNPSLSLMMKVVLWNSEAGHYRADKWVKPALN